MADLLSDNEVTEQLQHLPDWNHDGAALVREVKLPGFPQAIQAVNRIAEIAEQENHHPDIDIRWRTLIFRCSTHSKGGVTAADVSMAGEIDSVVEAIQG